MKKGQRIGEGKGFVSSPIHASVSGTVVSIEVMEHPGGSFVPCIVIENDRREEWAESIRLNPDPAALSPEEIRKIVYEAGIVGMGGATFPSHVKYSPVEGKKVDTVILNGVECEPYLTADHRLMLERSERIVAGLGYIMRSVGCGRGVIAIEDNKMDAVTALEKAAAANPDITVVVLKEKYPQGSEKQLIYACTGKEVPVGGLPLAVGVIVNNVGTAAAIADAVEMGIPLIERYVTVSGTGIRKPGQLPGEDRHPLQRTDRPERRLCRRGETDHRRWADDGEDGLFRGSAGCQGVFRHRGVEETGGGPTEGVPLRALRQMHRRLPRLSRTDLARQAGETGRLGRSGNGQCHELYRMRFLCLCLSGPDSPDSAYPQGQTGRPGCKGQGKCSKVMEELIR